MSEPPNVGNLIAEAEGAATAGDFVSAEELLRDAARLQENELGPLHPDLANTLNNLAIVAEKSGRPDDAETFFRRAVAIASASLPADDPMVVASRQNLEDFCHARGLPIDRPDAAPAPAAAPPSPHSVLNRRAEHRRVDVRHKTENLLLVSPHLVAADEAPRWVGRRFVPVVRCETGGDGVDVVGIGLNQSPQHRIALISWREAGHYYSLSHILNTY